MILSPPIASQWNPVLVLRRNVDSDLIFFLFFPPIARSERYHHLASDEDEETNDEESSLEIRQFASWSHRFSKVCGASRVLRGRRGGGHQRMEKSCHELSLPQSVSLTRSSLQVYSSTEHLATPSNLSFSSDRSHSEDKEDRSDVGGLSPSPTPAESGVEGRNAGRMAR